MPTHDESQPGASLEAEYRRRVEARESRVRARYPRIGGLVLALTSEPSSTTAFQKGAEGERRVAARFAKLCGDDVLLLHNRLLGVGRRDGDIDHIAIAPTGIYVIDAKNYKDAKVEVRRSGGIVRDRQEKLFVRGRDCTKFVTGMSKQTTAVLVALSGTPYAEVPIQPILCFIDARLPLLFNESIAGIPLLGPGSVSRTIRKPGPLMPEGRWELANLLAGALPPSHRPPSDE